jgi:hypothetical protein
VQVDDTAVVKQRRKKRVKDPTLAKGLPFVYVAWVWSPKFQQWFLLGFIRGSDRLTPKRIRRWRERYTIPPAYVLRFRELFVSVAAPGDESDPELMYELRRLKAENRAAASFSSLNTSFRPRPFPKKRPPEVSYGSRTR